MTLEQYQRERDGAPNRANARRWGMERVLVDDAERHYGRGFGSMRAERWQATLDRLGAMPTHRLPSLAELTRAHAVTEIPTTLDDAGTEPDLEHVAEE